MSIYIPRDYYYSLDYPFILATASKNKPQKMLNCIVASTITTGHNNNTTQLIIILIKEAFDVLYNHYGFISSYLINLKKMNGAC